MKRREFINKTFIGLPMLMSNPSLLWGTQKTNAMMRPTPRSVIVIGAGISGLAAAKKLQENGFTVTVLEAQDRIGGRLRTNRTLGVAFDEGASWIHGVTGNPITTLAQQAGMTTFFTDSSSRKAYDIGGALINETTLDSTETAYNNMLTTLRNSGSLTQSFETVFNNLYPTEATNRLWKFFLSTFMTFDRGDLNNTSSLYYNEGLKFGGEERISTNGYDTIPTYLATGLNIQLNQRVSSINYTNSTVAVTHNGTTSQADYVLVTVPLGVLKNNAIAFTPALPTTKQTAIQKVGMNCVNKFLLTWNTAFWDNEQYIIYTPETRDKFNYFVNVKRFHPSVNALMTFAYADYGRQTETMTDAQVIADIMAHLRDIYGNSIPEPTNMLRTRWHTNENTYGSYAYTAIETQMQHFEDLATTINNKVFFAGEHTHIDYFSTAHGAYLSGIREADKMIALATLPVELATFEAYAKENEVTLKWTTEAERNTKYFTIQQSRDGQTFIDIGNVNAKGANAVYDFVDKKPFLGINYYRLKVNDIDEEVSYSKIISVVVDASFADIKIFPTIISDNLNIATQNGKITDVQVLNMAGQTLLHQKYNNENYNAIISIAHLPTGIYIVKAANNRGEMRTSKIFKN